MLTISRKFILYFVFIVIILLCLFPFYWVLILSTHNRQEIMSSGIQLSFGDSLADNFRFITEKSVFVQAFINSIFVSTTSTVLTVIFSVSCGFAFAKYEFRGKKILFICLLATMMIPGQLGLVAFVKLMQLLGMYNTFWPLILSFGSAFGIFWMMQNIKEYVPTEMLESARMDGCGEARLISRFVFPIVLPAASAFAIISFIGSWNSFLIPLILLQDEVKFTVPLAIASMQNRMDIEYGAQFLAVVIGTVPLILLFVAASRKIISGMTEGAIKG